MRKAKLSIDAPKGSLKDLKPIWAYLRPYQKIIIGVLLSLTIASVAVLSLGVGIRYMIDNGFSATKTGTFDSIFIGLGFVVVALAVSTYFRFLLVTKLGEKVISKLRKDIYSNLVFLSPSFYETTKTSDIITRITTDTSILQMVIGSSMSIALRNILLLIGGIFMLIITSPELTGYTAILVPLVVIPIITLGKRVRNYSKIAQEKVAGLSFHLDETLSGLKTVQSYNRERLECNRFAKRVKEALSAAMDRVKLRALLTMLVILFAFGSVGIVLWLGGRNVLSGEMTAGELSSFVFYAIIVAGAFGAISEVIGDLQRAAGATERLLEFLHIKSDISDPEEPIPLPKRIKGYLSFNSVNFSYPSRKNRKALSDFNCKISPAETIAIVGPSGAGKSTIFQLLLRFYDTSEGRITIDDIDTKNLSLEDLRSIFSYVSQDACIFSDTIYANIAFGRPDASEDEIITAAKAARAWEFIKKLPNGLQSFVGEKGIRLSGGEKQRIVIARAILKNSPILLLDEATSALDSENEKLVQEALNALTKNRTTLVIAHRLSTVRNANRIMVLKDGKIEAMGTHNDLISSSPLYKRLTELQFNYPREVEFAETA